MILFSHSPSAKNSNRGFTLLELLIAITMLAFVSFFTVRTLKNVVFNSKRIQGEIDINTELNAAVSLLKSDIARAFNSRDLYIAVYNEAQREHIKRWKEEQGKPQGQQQQQPQTQNPDGTTSTTGTPAVADPTQQQQQQINAGPPPEYKPRTELVLTQFIGEKDKLDFTSINGNSIRKSAHTSELMEVGYEVKKCKRRGKAKGNSDTECLWRRISYHLDSDVRVGGQESVLIEDVTAFELKYLRKQSEDELEWRDNWPLENALTQNRLPTAVEITLEVEKTTDKEGINKKKKRVVAYVPIDFENNQNIINILKMNAQGNPNDGVQNQQNMQFQNLDDGYDSDPNLNPQGGF